MSMHDTSRAYEREQCAKMGRGLILSLVGLLFCWLPGLGLLLSAIGFVMLMGRITMRHRVRQVFFTLISFIALVACIGALCCELWLYSRKPTIVQDTGMWLWKQVTGLDTLPGQTTDMNGGEEYFYEDGTDFEGNGFGLGYDPALYGDTSFFGEESDFYDDETGSYDDASDSYDEEYCEDYGEYEFEPEGTLEEDAPPEGFYEEEAVG